MRWRRLDQLTTDEATTVDRLTILTGRTATEIVYQTNRSRAARIKFRTAVSLAFDVWDYLDGTTGQWSTNSGKQNRQFRSYAATLFDMEPRP